MRWSIAACVLVLAACGGPGVDPEREDASDEAVEQTSPITAQGPGGDLRREDAGEGAVEQTFRITAQGPEGAPISGRILVLGFDEGDTDGKAPQDGALPTFHAWTARENFDRPIDLQVWLPVGSHLLLVADVDGNRRPDRDELSSGLIVDFAPAPGAHPIVLDVPMSSLGAAPDLPTLEDVEIDASVWADGRSAALLFGAYRPEDVAGGAPVEGARPVHLCVRDPVPVQALRRVETHVPPPGLRWFVVLDLNGDYLPDSEEPTAPVVGAVGERSVIFGAAPGTFPRHRTYMHTPN